MGIANETMMALFAANLEVLTGVDRIVGITICVALSFSLLFTSSRFLSVLSMVSLFAICFSVFALLVSGIALPGGAAQPPFDDFHGLWRPRGIMTIMGLALFSYASHPALPSVYWSLKNPTKEFKPACIKAFCMATLFYLSVSTIGYYFYGDYVKQVFTVNLGKDLQGNGERYLQFLAILTGAGFAVKLQGTTPLILAPITVVLEELIGVKGGGFSAKRVVMLVILAVVSWGIAAIFAQEVAILAGLCGSVLCMTTSIIFPLFMYVTLAWKDLRPFQRAPLLIIGSLGVVLALYGGFLSVQKVVESHSSLG